MSRPSRVASMRAATRRSRVQDCAAWVVSAKPRTASLSSIARSTRIVGELVDLGRESLRAGEAEDVIDAVRLTPVHDLRPTIVSVPADGDASRRSRRRIARSETADMATNLDSGGRLARPQDHGHQTTGGG